jgi:ribosomal protein L11 methylase PrmA
VEKYKPDIGYIPTVPAVVDAILTLAEVNKQDIVYDLGSGDGRVLIAAAQQFGARGVGIDIDPARIRDAETNARQAGVADLVTFHQQDLYKSNFWEATVVVLYLLPHLNLRLRPMLFQQLRPGVRLVSHDFDMGDWHPNQTIQVQAEEPATLYQWVMPLQIPQHLRSSLF